jgi:hypothetical protein
MIDYILYGEFDINEGNVIKVEYPSKIGINETLLASYLIPEGMHNFSTDCFCFILNKKLDYEKYLTNSINSVIDKLNINQVRYLNLNKNNLIDKSFQLKKLYNFNLFNNQWEAFNVTDQSMKENNLYLRIALDKGEGYYNILICNSENVANPEEIVFSM